MQPHIATGEGPAAWSQVPGRLDRAHQGEGSPRRRLPPQMPGKDHALPQGPRERFLAQFSSQIYFYSPAARLGRRHCTCIPECRGPQGPLSWRAPGPGSCLSQGGRPPVRLQVSGAGTPSASRSQAPSISQQGRQSFGNPGSQAGSVSPLPGRGAGLTPSPTESWWPSRAGTDPHLGPRVIAGAPAPQGFSRARCAVVAWLPPQSAREARAQPPDCTDEKGRL